MKSVAVQEHLKILYTDGLPWKLKEAMLRDRDYDKWTFTEVQSEAKRQQNILNYMNRGRTRFNDQQGQDAGDKDRGG